MRTITKYRKAMFGITLLLAICIMVGMIHSYVQLVNIVHATNQQTLEQKINHILTDERLAGSQIGISIRNATTGEEIYHHNGEDLLHPASNMKIVTAVTALENLGPNYQFATEILTDGKIENHILHGNLYLKGKGDPSIIVEDLVELSKSLKKLGIKEVKGHLIGDDSWYDSVRLSQDLNWSDEFNHTGAQISALTLSPDCDFDIGTVKIEVLPTNGDTAEIKVTPETDYVSIKNQTKMVNMNETSHISIEREHGTNQIVVSGTVAKDSATTKKWIAVWEPTGLVLNVFKKTLEQEGIQFQNSSRVKIATTPNNTTLLVEKKSMPLKELLIPFMKLSNNGIGEVFVKEVGKVVYDEGSWESGIEVMKDTIKGFGVRADTIQIRDGSGMSHKNLIPASELTRVLYAIQKKGWYNEFAKSLPIGGMSDRYVGGTLRNRFTEDITKGKVFAKTGSLTGVFTLSGYMKTIDGTNLIFSILNNNFLVKESDIAAIQDEIIKIFAKHNYE